MNPETGKTLRWLIVALFLAGITAFTIWKVEALMGKASKSVGSGLDRVLASITGNDTNITAGRAVISDQIAISELALMEMNMNAVRELESSATLLKYLPLGTKRILVRGHFRVKAGYRLTPGVSLRMDGETLVANFPKAEVLSVELLNIEELLSDNGWANKVTGEDRAWLMRELKQQMEEDARASGMLDTVESTLHNRLKDLAGVKAVRLDRNPSPQ